jgi:hypothetical protein
MPTTDHPVAYVTLTAGDGDLIVPDGMRFRLPRLHFGNGDRPDEGYGLETRGRTAVPARRSREIPLFEVASNPTVRLDEVRERRFDVGHGWVRERPLSERGPIPADLTGCVFQIVPHWRPRTQQGAREGLLRLMRRRIETQPKRWWERL